MAIETTHKNREVSYNEVTDQWECKSLNISGATLSSLRMKIDKLELDSRKAVAVPCLVLHPFHGGYGGKKNISEGKIVDALPKRPGQQRYVAVMLPSGGGDRLSRQEKSLVGLYPDTEATRAAYELYTLQAEVVAKEAAKAETIYKAIKPMTEANISELVKLREGEANAT